MLQAFLYILTHYDSRAATTVACFAAATKCQAEAPVRLVDDCLAVLDRQRNPSFPKMGAAVSSPTHFALPHSSQVHPAEQVLLAMTCME